MPALPRSWLAALLAALLAGAPASAGDFRFPVDCTLGRDCFIQHHVDRDPGRGATDFACGGLTYDDHDGTDIRLADLSAMQAGVAVLSAGDGTVHGLRDGIPDAVFGEPGAPDVRGRECGNGVLVARDDGSQLQYCHLRAGSIAVKSGDRVTAGQPLGLIGLSGETQFPHLHFIVRDTAGAVVDPFDARAATEPCALDDTESLWAQPVAYKPGGVLAAGFLDRMPEYAEVKAGTAALPELPAGAPALVFWAHFYGLSAGDRLELRLAAPDGEAVAVSAHQMPRDRAAEFRAVGRRANAAWPQGTYVGAARLIRGEAVIEERAASIQIR